MAGGRGRRRHRRAGRRAPAAGALAPAAQITVYEQADRARRQAAHRRAGRPAGRTGRRVVPGPRSGRRGLGRGGAGPPARAGRRRWCTRDRAGRRSRSAVGCGRCPPARWSAYPAIWRRWPAVARAGRRSDRDAGRPVLGAGRGRRRRRAGPRAGSATRWSTGWSTRCWAACTPAGPTRCPWPPPCPRWPAGRTRAHPGRRGPGRAGAPRRGRPAAPVFATLPAGWAGWSRRSPAASGADAAGDRHGRCASWPATGDRAGGCWSARPGTLSWWTADAVVLAVPARPAARLLAGVDPAAAASGRARWTTPASRWSPWRCRAADAAGAVRLPGAGDRGPADQGGDLLHHQVGAPAPRRTGWRWCAPRSAGTARRRRCSAPTRTWPPRCTGELSAVLGAPLPDPGRRPRAAVGRGAAAVRARPPGPGRGRAGRAARPHPTLALAGAGYDGVGIPVCVTLRRDGRRGDHRGTGRIGEHDRADQRGPAAGAERHHPLHHVVGVPGQRAAAGAAGRASTGEVEALLRPSWPARTWWSAAPTTCPGCAPTPT